MSITSNIANVASALTTGSLVNNLNADLLDGQTASYFTNLSNTNISSANTWLQANDASTLTASKSYTDTSNTNNLIYTNNAISSNVTLLQGINSTQNTIISAAYGHANAAYNTANTKFNSSGGTISGDVTVSGNVTVQGTTTTLDVDTLTVEDKNITLANVATPTNVTADGAGITILGTTNKTWNWVNTSSSWTSSENIDLLTGKSYKINGTDVLSGSSLGSGVTGSSLTSVGTLTSLNVSGNTTLGDANTDTLTINGTAVSIPNNLNFDSNTLFIDAANNRVGVGTNTPAQLLDVVGGIIGSRGGSTGVRADVWAQQNDFYSGPSYRGTSIYAWGSTATGTDANIARANLGSLCFQNLSNALIWSNTSIPLIFANNAGTETMRLTAAGRLGIGDTSPAYKLDVTCGNGDGLRINSSLNGVLAFAQNGTTTGQILGTNAGVGEMIFKAQRAMQFYTGGITTPVGYSCFGPNGGLTVGNSSLNIYGIPANGLLVQNNVSVGATSVPYSIDKQLTVQVGNTTATGSSAAITCGGYSSFDDSIISLIESFGARRDGNTTFGGRHGAAYRRADGTAIASGANLGYYAFGGQWGTDTSFQSAKVLYPASIVGIVEGSFTSATAMPTGLSFRTGSTGEALSSPNTSYGTERLRITSAGNYEFKQNTGSGNNSVSFNTSIQNALTLDLNGRLGIGTNAPTEKLEVLGGAVVSRAASSSTTAGIWAQATDYWSGPTYRGVGLLQYGSASTGTTAGLSNANLGTILFQNGSAGLIQTNGAAPLVFGTLSAERLRIDPAGTLLLRQSSNAANTSVSFDTTIQNALTLDGSGWLSVGATPSEQGKFSVMGPAANQSSALGAIDAATVTIRNNQNSALNQKAKLVLSGTTDSKAVIAGYYENYNGAADTGSGLLFGTQYNAAGGVVERLRIKSTGHVRLQPMAASEAAGENGDIYYDSTNNRLRAYVNGGWKTITTA